MYYEGERLKDQLANARGSILLKNPAGYECGPRPIAWFVYTMQRSPEVGLFGVGIRGGGLQYVQFETWSDWNHVSGLDKNIDSVRRADHPQLRPKVESKRQPCNGTCGSNRTLHCLQPSKAWQH